MWRMQIKHGMRNYELVGDLWVLRDILVFPWLIYFNYRAYFPML